MDTAEIDEIVERYRYEDCWLVGILQDIQRKANYLPQECLEYVAERLGVPESRVYGLATFYKTFSLTQRGRHHIGACLGTACHVRGGERIVRRLEMELKVRRGETTDDGRFTLETVRCLGCCSLAPVVRIDDDTHGRLTQGKSLEIVKEYE